MECQLVASGPVSASPSPMTQAATRSGLSKTAPVRVHERVSELAAFVDRARRGRSCMARDAARKRELAKELAQAVLVARDVRVELGVGPLEVRARDHCRSAVARPAHEDGIEVEALDHAVEVRVEEIEAGRRSPVPEQPWLRVFDAERLAEQGIVQEVDLADREVVGGAPPGIDQLELARCHHPTTIPERYLDATPLRMTAISAGWVTAGMWPVSSSTTVTSSGLGSRPIISSWSSSGVTGSRSWRR